MRLVAWNCNQAFRKKQQLLLDLNPDIAVIPECENPAKRGDWSAFTERRWTGHNHNKGLGVFTRNGLSITNTTKIDDAEYFLHVETEEVDVFAVWAMNNKEDPQQRYIGQLYTALRNHPDLFNENTIVAGDLNWNIIWDESPNSSLYGNFSDTLELLNLQGLQSAYHRYNDVEFGGEDHPTFYMHKKKARSYHIDYVFVPKTLMTSNGAGVTVGRYSAWIDASDHMPVLVEF